LKVGGWKLEVGGHVRKAENRFQSRSAKLSYTEMTLHNWEQLCTLKVII